MGRPINKKFFGNADGKQGIGGESIDYFDINVTGTLYAPNATLTGTFSAPQITGGVRATGTVTTDGSGSTQYAILGNPGSGYTSAPTFTLSASTTGTAATFTVLLTGTRQNALSFNSFVPGGSSAVAGGDIVKQAGSRRYLVKNSQGTGVVKLVTTNSLSEGEMNLIATDASGATYWVKKLTARKAILVSRSGSPAINMVTDAAGVSTGVAGWTLGPAAGNIVSVANG